MLGDEVFSLPRQGFVTFFLSRRVGFDDPAWETLATIAFDESSYPLTQWLLDNNLPPHTSLSADASGDGVSLLMAYGLESDPSLDLRPRLPRTTIDPAALSLVLPAERPHVSTLAETSDDLRTWTTDGIALSVPDPAGRRTAMMPRSGRERYLRFRVHHAGPGTALLAEGPLQVSFEDVAPGSTAGLGDSGAPDNLAWWTAAGSVVDEASDENPPANPGNALLFRPPFRRMGPPHYFSVISEAVRPLGRCQRTGRGTDRLPDVRGQLGKRL